MSTGNKNVNNRIFTFMVTMRPPTPPIFVAAMRVDAFEDDTLLFEDFVDERWQVRSLVKSTEWVAVTTLEQDVEATVPYPTDVTCGNCQFWLPINSGDAHDVIHISVADSVVGKCDNPVGIPGTVHLHSFCCNQFSPKKEEANATG